MQEKRESYSGESVPKEDRERMQKIGYPNFVSSKVFEKIGVEGKRILDAGAGPNPKLGEFIKEHNGKYVACDLREDMLKDMGDAALQEGWELPLRVQGDVKALPFENDAFDVVHERFVLMNLSPENRTSALQEFSRVGKNKVVLIEYDWTPMASPDAPELVERFRSAAFRLFEAAHTDPHFGAKIEELVRAVDPDIAVSVERFSREAATENVPELVLNCRGMEAGARKMGDEELADEFTELAKAFDKANVHFRPPDIVAAVIEK